MPGVLNDSRHGDTPALSRLTRLIGLGAALAAALALGGCSRISGIEKELTATTSAQLQGEREIQALKARLDSVEKQLAMDNQTLLLMTRAIQAQRGALAQMDRTVTLLATKGPTPASVRQRQRQRRPARAKRR